LLGVGGFKAVVGPVAQVEAELPQAFLKLDFKVACGLRSEGLLLKSQENGNEPLDMGGQGLQEGRREKILAAGACQKERQQGRVRHSGVLSWGVLVA
jgi:hypothetical protein